jgi:hypothetical protein
MLFIICGVLSAQATFRIEEYDDLLPEINLLIDDGNFIPDRILLFYSPLGQDSSPILYYDTSTNIMNSLPVSQIKMERRSITSQYFWDPYTKMNYMFCRERLTLEDDKSGWYLLEFINNTLSFQLKSNDRYWAHYSPPFVQISGSRLFSSRYVYKKNT